MAAALGAIIFKVFRDDGTVSAEQQLQAKINLKAPGTENPDLLILHFPEARRPV